MASQYYDIEPTPGEHIAAAAMQVSLAFPLAAGVEAICLYHYWGWFLAPVFPIVPDISYLDSLCLTLFIMVLTPTYRTLARHQYETIWHDFTHGVVVSVIHPLILLAVGYVATLIIF